MIQKLKIQIPFTFVRPKPEATEAIDHRITLDLTAIFIHSVQKKNTYLKAIYISLYIILN